VLASNRQKISDVYLDTGAVRLKAQAKTSSAAPTASQAEEAAPPPPSENVERLVAVFFVLPGISSNIFHPE
jgi:hypothetical protein